MSEPTAPEQHPCFLCDTITDRLASATLPDKPPQKPNDAVFLCPPCQPDWNFAVLAECRLNPPTKSS
jgi:hypothetical protein